MIVGQIFHNNMLQVNITLRDTETDDVFIGVITTDPTEAEAAVFKATQKMREEMRKEEPVF